MGNKENILAKMEKFPEGSIVYFVRTKYGQQRTVYPAIVEDWYSDCMIINPLVVATKVYIDDEPVSDIFVPTRFKKLPKNWSYEMTFCNIEERNVGSYDCIVNIDMKSPNELLKAYQDGIITTPDKAEHHEDYYVEITKEGWRVNRRYGDLSCDEFGRRKNLHINYFDVYKTFNEAQKAVDDYESELNRQANLSDYEWVVEEIDRTLERFKKTFCVEDDIIKEMRKQLLSLDNVEDLEIRISANSVQWKYCKNKRWNTITV